MSNIDKRALRKKLNRRLNDAFGFQRTSGGKHTMISLSIDECKSVLVALDELEAKARRNYELTEALKQTVSGYKSCLRMGHDRILDLGGDCDSPEVMIAGNPDIQQAEKTIAAAAGKGEAS